MPEAKFHQKIAWFNFICCLMVIWTHSGNADLFFPELGQDAPWWHFQYPVMQEILRVDIPCFIMLSAYLFYRNFTMKRLGEKLNKRLHSLLVPYLLWNTIYYVAYVAASRIPGLQTIANRTDLVITPSGAWQAITKYTFNPVFWFMYQIILLVLLAPVLYLFLKNIWTGAAFLLVLLVALFKGVALPELNLDALIYYSFAAYAVLHGRKWAEAVWSWKRAALGVCLLAVGIVLSRSYYNMAAVMAQILLSSWAKCTRSRPKRWENVSSFLPLAGAAWFFGPIPWNSSGHFSAGGKPFPFTVFTWRSTGPSTEAA